jgi:2-oxoglutarate ferredoxin oxidoreductase subunit gamma
MKEYRIIISGFGGQGILSAGRILACAGMLEDKHVSWVPSYGPEMRGGTANCHVIIAKEPIASPILSEANILIVMNEPSILKFESYVKKDGIIISDSSIINNYKADNNINHIQIPATKMANDMGNAALANIIILGKLFDKTALVLKDSIIESFKSVLPENKHYLIQIEIKAFNMGIEY